ncbi:MAG: RNA methyltransferase [Flavobacterium sp.]|nr:RNA methyltransferase [Flavobacterium sp.]
MVSKNQIKLISSLQQKKHRIKEQLFVSEGIKCIQELLNASFEPVYLFATAPVFPEEYASNVTYVSATELQKMSALSSANTCLAVFKIPQTKQRHERGLIVALDDVRDPGNLGTIIRLCDWFGIEQLFCSAETVDVYNPKVVQATMGSIARVAVHYLDLPSLIASTHLPVFGTFMDGKSIYDSTLPDSGIIVMGNEANGISAEISEMITKRISIPKFGTLQQTESLNVATATAIVLSEFKRS